MPQATVVSRPSLAGGGVAPAFMEHEAAGAVRVLAEARRRRRPARTAPPAGRRPSPRAGTRAPRKASGSVSPRTCAEGPASGSAAAGTPSSVAELVVPAQRVDVEQHRARRVRVVGHRAAGELEGEPGVDRPEAHASRSRPVARARRRSRAATRSSCRRSRGRSRARCARARAPRSPCSRSSSQRAAVRRSCQTIARWSGSPVRSSQATTVSRWLVMPIAPRPGRRRRRRRRAPRRRPRATRPRSRRRRARPSRAAGSAA